MDKFIKYEEVGDYCTYRPTTRIEYSILKQLNYNSCAWEKKDIETVMETYNNAKKPSEKQVEILNFIVAKEREIFKSIFPFYEMVILPIYRDLIDTEEDEIARNERELNKILGINRIEIPARENSKSLCFSIQFDFSYDEEHGLYFMFNETEIIGFFGIGDLDYRVIDIRENGLRNNDNKPLGVSFATINDKEIFRGEFYFDEEIKVQLKKGFISITLSCNHQSSTTLIVNLKNDVNNFTLEEILK